MSSIFTDHGAGSTPCPEESAAKRRIMVAVRSIASPVGNPAAENEDNYLLIDGDGRVESLRNQKRHRGRLADWPKNHRRLAVLDGVGGHGRGRLLTERVVEELIALLAFNSQEALNQALDRLHLQIRAEFAPPAGGRQPGATLLLIEIPPSGPAFLYHVGDSRLFALRPEGVELLTVDHSPPTVSALQGLLDEEEWRRQVLGECRSAISQAFGMGSRLASTETMSADLVELGAEQLPGFLSHLPDRRSLPLAPGSLFLLATDGLWSYRQPLRFLTALSAMLDGDQRDLAALADRMLDGHCLASRDERRHDNTSFILFRVG